MKKTKKKQLERLERQMKMKVLLYRILAVVSFGFYIHPLTAFENPAHPRDAEEFQREIDDEQYRQNREILDIIDPDNAPHSTEDAKNFVNKDE